MFLRAMIEITPDETFTGALARCVRDNINYIPEDINSFNAAKTRGERAG